jgi:hypothetical protein
MVGTLRFAHPTHYALLAIFPEREAVSPKNGWTRTGPHFIDFDFG